MKRKVLSFLMAAVMLVCSCFCCGAVNLDVSINDGLGALRKQFDRDKGPKTDSYAIDYSYFSPVKTPDDTTKYPLVIIMAGAREGTYEGRELTANEFALWSGIEYQERFQKSGGAFILIARSPEEKLLYWDSSKLVSPLKAAIDDFTVKHPNVDKNRVYVMGWCLGAKGAVNLAVKYPSLCSAVVLMVPPFKLSESEAEVLSCIPVWLMGCKNDSYAVYNLYIKPSWEALKEYSANPAVLRLTSYATAPDTTFFFHHNVWLNVSHDFQYQGEGYTGMKTVDGNGKVIDTADGFIKQISAHGVKTHELVFEEDETCECMCHSKNIIVRLFWIVYAALGFYTKAVNETCECGAKHWKEIK